ncbi:hypothetical protein [Myxosarcina sp. GI1]|uniref:hypothetical protein n=1 Tax=Myxosarcina sp. GI1 TaxID=1541065 RepID=UPI00056AF965|nr:hypothetical protein [Myxosarcina sp. GI1]
MIQPQLLVEIRTFNQPFPESEDIPTITIYHDSHDNYFMSSGIEEIKNAVLRIVPHLGTNCRHPLLFSVRLLPGTETDAIVASMSYSSSSKPRKRQSKFNKQA